MNNPLAAFFLAPYRVNFYQAVRLIQRYVDPESFHRLTFQANAHFCPSIGDISQLTHAKTNRDQPLCLTVNGIGVYGIQSILPEHDTQAILLHAHKPHSAMVDFLTIFNTYMLHQRYDAWKKMHFYVGDEQGIAMNAQPMQAFIFALTGIDAETLPLRPAHHIIDYATYYLHKQRPKAGLCLLLTHFFKLDEVTLNEYLGQWVPLDVKQRACLGNNHVLSSSSFEQSGQLGHRFWSIDTAFAVCINVKRVKMLRRLLPHQQLTHDIMHTIRRYIGPYHEIHIRLIIQPKALAALRLNQHNTHYLGWNTFVGEPHKNPSRPHYLSLTSARLAFAKKVATFQRSVIAPPTEAV